MTMFNEPKFSEDIGVEREIGARRIERRLGKTATYGLFDCDCACAAPPDYSGLANASEESAQIMADLGREQLAEARRQYDLNRETADRVAQSQLELMDQTKAQGDDYYSHWKANAQPLETALADEAAAAGTEAKQQEAVDRAVADAQGGYTRALNQALRQGRRYGLNPAATTGAMAVMQAQNTAGAATAAREKEKALGYAKKLDVAGLLRGMTGASQGAYSVANQSGNSAVANQMAPGQALQSGMAAGASTVGSGRQLLQSGLGTILGSQTDIARINAQMAMSGDDGFGSLLGGLGALGQGLGAMGVSFSSSKKLKTAKRKTDAVLRGVRNLDIEDWKYKKGVADEGRHTGPYAEDVRREFGDLAAPGGKVLDMISMQGIMLKAIQELADEVDQLGGKKKRGRTIDGKARRVS